MFNLTFYDNPKMSVEHTTSSNVIKNPILIILIVSMFSLLIVFLGYQDFKKNRLLNKQVQGKITQGNCQTNLTRVSDSGRRGVRSTTTCIVNYKYTVDNKELSGTYTGDMFTETQIGKEVTIYYNDKEPGYSSMNKNVYRGVIIMFVGLLLFGLVAYSLFFPESNKN